MQLRAHQKDQETSNRQRRPFLCLHCIHNACHITTQSVLHVAQTVCTDALKFNYHYIATVALWTSVFQPRRTPRCSAPDPTSCCPPPQRHMIPRATMCHHHGRERQIPLRPSIVERRPHRADTAYGNTKNRGWLGHFRTHRNVPGPLVVGGSVSLYCFITQYYSSYCHYNVCTCSLSCSLSLHNSWRTKVFNVCACDRLWRP